MAWVSRRRGFGLQFLYRPSGSAAAKKQRELIGGIIGHGLEIANYWIGRACRYIGT